MLRLLLFVWGRGRLLLRVAVAASFASVLALASLSAQTFSVIHDFTGGQDGATPMAGLTRDNAGNLLGTTNYGGITGGNCGASGCGIVYKMSNRGGGWVLAPLYAFQGGDDGTNPGMANVSIGASGVLYSSTFYGGGVCEGSATGCGTVFKLQPAPYNCPSVMCSWNETILHRFVGTDGAGPVGALLIDQEGNLYGAANTGNFRNGGSVYQLNSSNGWGEQILFHPYGYPGSSVSPDHSGNLYGSTYIGMRSLGTVYQLVPSGGNWVGTEIHDFTGGVDGAYPVSGVIFDSLGNLYGTTSAAGSGNGGTVFELSPSGDSWEYRVLYSFTGPNNDRQVVGPVGTLVMDSSGNLYGTTISDGAHGYGAVFKLTPANGSWTYTSLHDFTNGSDGGYPYANLVFDTQGNIYGTASSGGAFGQGVVFEITP